MSVITVVYYYYHVSGIRAYPVNPKTDTMIPMAILTGYLGAGKTTLLNRILNSEHGMRIAVFVNDFASINVDSRLIVGVEGDTITLSNGCICYTIRENLVQLITTVIKSDTVPDYILIEPSGVTDTSRILLTFNRSILRNLVRIDSIIAIVDSEQFKSLDEKPKRLIHEQIRVSDIVILNKADLISKKVMQEVRQQVDDIIDKAQIVEAKYCDVPIDSIIDIATYNPQTAFDTSGPGVHAHNVDEFHDYSHNDRSLVFATWAWESEKQVVLSEIRSVLSNLPGSIFRAKGIIYAREVPDKQIILQLVGNRVSLTEGNSWGDSTPKNQIALIGDISAVDKGLLTEQFEQCYASKSRESDVSKMVDGVMKWLRVK